MKLRLTTLLNKGASGIVKKTVFFLLLMFSCPVFSQDGSIEDTKKRADKLFKDEAYSEAYGLYSQLVSNFPKDPEYNFRLGVCMIFAEPDKKKCIPYLQLAASNPQAPVEVRFYLGKAYHINYLFDEAIKNYNEFKKNSSSSLQKKLLVDREILACANGKRLLSNLTDLVIVNKKVLSENDYFRSYDLKKTGGKLLIKPDEFKTSTDKKKNDKSVIFLPAKGNIVYFSSYGNNTDNGRDIYRVQRTANGFGKPEKVKGINTEFDEDYPFLHPDGKTLYFSSKGHNSMGGYDIFKSTLNEATGVWGPPVNLEFPINSPDDDFLFVTDSAEKIACFSTGRQSPPGKIDVLKIKTKRRPIDLLAVKGTVIKGTPEHNLTSTIIIKDIFTDEPIGTYEANENGLYNLELPNGGKFLFTVETPGMETQSSQVSMPSGSNSKPFRQTISYEQGKLKILNYFDELPSDDNYLQYLSVIEKKARLDISDESEEDEAEPLAQNNTPAQNTTTKTGSAETNNPPTDTSPATATEPKKSLNNKELAKMAKEDASEARQEATQLRRDAGNVRETGNQQKAEAEKKLAEAQEALTQAESIADENEKNEAIAEAETQKKSAENDLAIAERLIAYSQTMEEDANNKQKEADLNEQYAKELEKSAGKNSKESIAKLEDLQKQIASLSSNKRESETMINNLKTEIDEKEKQISDLETTNTDLRSSVNELNASITSKEDELAKTKKKNKKEIITNELNDLKAERTEKENQVASNETQLAQLNDEMTVLKGELDLANKIKTEPRPASSETETKVIIASNSELSNKYKKQTIVADPTDREQVEEAIIATNNYNRDIDKAIADNRNLLKNTTQSAEKLKINNEIKALEAAKKQNEKSIAANTKLMADLERNPPPKKAPEVKDTYEPIVASNPTEAITKLDNLNKKLDVYDNVNFEYNSYQSPAAQNLKLEADAKINEAVAKQKKLKDEIGTSRTEIQNTNFDSSRNTSTIPQLTKEAEDFAASAQKLREEARTKEGDEKEKSLSEAKKLDDQANDKYIEAAEVTRNDNAIIISTNLENIQNLIKTNQAPQDELGQAKALNEESKAAFKKAAEIRKEAKSLTSKGAMLGTFSNAEEKEAEAILKQQQAIEILMKSNPLFNLKTPATSTTNIAKGEVTETPKLEDKLVNINTGLSDLATAKTESYEKLYEANETELEQLGTTLNNRQADIDKVPALKTDFLKGSKKVDNARELKGKSDGATNPNEKLSELISAVKAQNEAIKLYNSVGQELDKTVASSNPNTNPNTASTPNTITETVPPTTPPASVAPLPANVKVIEVANLARKDTTPIDVVNHLDAFEPVITNPNASASAKAAISNLKDIEAKNNSIESDLNKARTELAKGNIPLTENPKNLRRKADGLLDQADELNDDAGDLRSQAKGAKGEDKEKILEEAKELETKAQEKMLESATLRQLANETEYKTNIKAIDDLLARARIDNPSLAEEIEQKMADYGPLKSQIRNLRDEANALSNDAAKLGAMSNAEDKEVEFIKKQESLLNRLKKQYPDYVIQQVNPGDNNLDTTALLAQRAELQSRQYSELTDLTNAFSLEYESSQNQVPEVLSPEQAAIRQNAEDLNSESKSLLIKASQENDHAKKIKLLTLAVKTGNAANEQLAALVREKNTSSEPVVSTPPDENRLDDIGTRMNGTPEDNGTQPTETPSRQPEPVSNTTLVKVEGLEVIKGNAYSVNKPIPVDAKIEDGLTFRVQIGAFKTKIPNNAFGGLSPLNGETTASGYIRYTAGNFNKLENASAVKNDLRRLGYRDAFVVAYLNGKRITLAEAVEMLKQQGIDVDMTAPQTAGITANANIPKAAVPEIAPENMVQVSKELDKINGLLYTIQVGVFTRQVTKKQLFNLKPIFSEPLNNGLFRYTAGIYNNPEKLLNDKERVIGMGVKDAFVSAYLNGKRIPFAEGKRLQSSDETIQMEEENPIIFPDATIPEGPVNTAPIDPTVRLFTNNVSSYPTPTEENGIKTTEDGICFKVQIGAFSKQVPEEVAAKFAAIKDWPVENKQINGLYVYNVGNFSEVRFAKQLKEEIFKMGIPDAFITVYRDGRKIYGPEAEALMR